MPFMSKKSNKTASVMKLINGSPAANPIIDSSFKDEVIRPIEEQRTKAAIESAMPKEQREKPRDSTEMNITSELVSTLLSPVLERFGCCRCGRCMAEASVTAFERLPKLTYKINGPEDLAAAQKLKEQNRRKAMMILIGIASERRKLSKHQK